MNIVHSIVRRQEGSESIRDYDIALNRLKCYQDDIYCGFTPNTNAAEFNPEPPVFACRFCTTKGYETVLALANEDGKIALQDIAKRGVNNQPLEGIQAHCNAIFDIAWMPGELQFVTASGDHTARLWNVSGSRIRQVDYFHAHTRSIKTAVFRHDDKAVFATGARDGAIMVWDIRASHNSLLKPDNCIYSAHSMASMSHSKSRKTLNHTSRAQSITGLAFQDDVSLLSCAAGDGVIKVWDLRKNYTVHKKDPVPKHVITYAGRSKRTGFSSMLIDPARTTVYASCMDNVIYAYNVSSYNSTPVAEFYGHQNRTYYVKTCLSPDGRYLASGSSDELAYIWHTNRSGTPLIKLTGHTEEVTCIAWCNSPETKIVTCADDSCHRVWRVGLEHKIENEDIEIRGHAEIVVNNSPLENLKLETTPTVTHRRFSWQEHTPNSDNTPMTATPGPSYEDTHDQASGSSSVKRSYSQMIGGTRSDGKYKSILSPIRENHEVSAKRHHVEARGARRLFSPGGDNSKAANTDCESSEGSSSSTVMNGAGFLPFSPTSNLPNFVIDGTAPHLLQMSPQKSKENVDWLTKIRKERYEQKVVRAMSEKACSPKAPVTPARRNSRSRSTEPQKVKTPKSPAPSLLDFFKISRECDKDCSDNTTTSSTTS